MADVVGSCPLEDFTGLKGRSDVEPAGIEFRLFVPSLQRGDDLEEWPYFSRAVGSRGIHLQAIRDSAVSGNSISRAGGGLWIDLNLTDNYVQGNSVLGGADALTAFRLTGSLGGNLLMGNIDVEAATRRTRWEVDARDPTDHFGAVAEVGWDPAEWE